VQRAELDLQALPVVVLHVNALRPLPTASLFTMNPSSPEDNSEGRSLNRT
jgi:hypothetical protein